ncbi:hypothetical protein WR25_10831 [Diploscapter pachys]|uniref:G-protein coupled receptors family 1 profile domain-containing protein n=1 Tax=Diploscapter pachys TaxID=2018661 RepID=A0A2A2JAH2_9BILA|nr:hypothetical protein WR25_10831 [Diploscapter pachys]
MHISRTLNVYVCLAVTVDRYIAVRYPLHSKIWCTPKKAVMVLVGIAVFTLIYRIPVFFELINDDKDCGLLIHTNFGKGPFMQVYYHIYTNILLNVIIPWIIMIFLNSYIVYLVHQAYKVRGNMQGKDAKNDSNKRRCTLMATAMIFCFILFNSINSVYRVC